MAAVGLGNLQLLDYVSSFIVKGLDVIQKTRCSMALVSTSSISQGEQVALLWPIILEKAAIKFAYRPFKWANSAANNAGVWCTIVGLDSSASGAKQIFFEDKVQFCENISPYLIAGPNTYSTPADDPISDLPPMKMGSNAVDGKRLILETMDVERIISAAPLARKYIRQYGGTQELLSGSHRWCIWIEDSDVASAMELEPLREIIRESRKTYREGAGRDAKRRPLVVPMHSVIQHFPTKRFHPCWKHHWECIAICPGRFETRRLRLKSQRVHGLRRAPRCICSVGFDAPSSVGGYCCWSAWKRNSIRKYGRL